ncbi:MAG: GDP-L-fucose synthase [Alphaproteobacteria bacterium]|nr:GDP-L-fucose synthase [Alphaproteobacteria bacterium]
MVGSAVCRALAGESCEVLMVSRDRLDLREQADVRAWMKAHRPDVIVLAAARVGGIGANAAYPADFYHDNLMISANVIHGAYACGVEKLLFLGSSCIYPKDADLPIAPDALLRGVLEPTNEAYALAKIAGLKMAQAYRAQHGCDFISAMPCNLYGPGDRYDLRGSHVIPALMMKAHEAARRGDDVLSVWGSGAPLREFLYVDDLAAALVFLLKYYSGSAPVNVGSGDEISIGDLARKVADVVGFRGGLVFDCSQPDGVYRKVMDSSVIKKAGWLPQISLDCGLGLAYADFCQMAFGEIKTAAVAES